jgi:hypothetical protein
MLIVVRREVEYVFFVVAQGLAVEVCDDPRAGPLAGWDELVRASGAPVFYRSDYLAAYHDSPLADLEQVRYLVVRDPAGDLPLAVVPIAVHRRSDPLGVLRRIHPGIEHEPVLLSHVWHCYDTKLIGSVERGDVVAAILAAMGDLASSWQVRWFGFVNVERGSATASALSAAGMPGAHMIDRFSTDLTGLTDLDGYLRRLGPRARANLTRSARRAAETGITTTVVGPADADLAEIAELCGRTAARFGNAGFYPAQTFASFVTALGPLVHIVQIRQHCRLVAVGVCLTDERRFHTWTCGVDYDVSGNASPYALLFAESVAQAIRLGLPVLEGGRSNEQFKQRHGLTGRHLDAYLARA